MSFLQVKNRARSLLNTAITTSSVQLVVTSGDGSLFPSSNFNLSLDTEIVLCTARTDDTFDITRAQESTTRTAHVAGTTIELRVTAGIITELQNALNGTTSGIAIANPTITSPVINGATINSSPTINFPIINSGTIYAGSIVSGTVINVPTINQGTVNSSVVIQSNITSGSAINVATGRVATKIVAASDASEASKMQADYICGGDGNDDVEIHQAINALPTSNGYTFGKVVLTEGTFRCNSTIRTSGDVIIQGAGVSYTGRAAGTWILSTASPMLNIGSGGTGLVSPTVKDLTIRGDVGCGGGLLLDMGNTFLIERVNVLNAGGDAIQLKGCDFGKIDQCHILNTSGRGIALTGSSGDITGTECSNIVIENCDFGDSELTANLYIGKATYVYIKSCHFETYDSNTEVPHIYVDDNSVNFIIMSDNTISQTRNINVNAISILNGYAIIGNTYFAGGETRDWIEVTAGAQLLVNNCNFGTAGRWAVEINGNLNNIISNSFFYQDRSVNSGNSCIYSSASGTQILGNIFSSTSGAMSNYYIWNAGAGGNISQNQCGAITGTAIRSDSDATNINGNNINVASLYGIDIQGGNNVNIQNNIISNAGANAILVRSGINCIITGNQLSAVSTVIVNSGTGTKIYGNNGYQETLSSGIAINTPSINEGTVTSAIITYTTITSGSIVNAPTGRMATYIIASASSPAIVRNQADYKCDGVDDHLQLRSALAAGTATNLPFTIQLTPGGYSFDATDGYVVEQDMSGYNHLIKIDAYGAEITYAGGNSATGVIYFRDNVSAGAWDPTSRLIIQGLKMTGNDSGVEGVTLRSISDFTMIDCQFVGFGPSNNRFAVDVFDNSGGQSEYTRFYRCHFWDNVTAIRFASTNGGAAQAVVEDCAFEANNTNNTNTQLLRLEGQNVARSYFRNNLFALAGASGQTAIYIDTNVDGTIFDVVGWDEHSATNGMRGIVTGANADGVVYINGLRGSTAGGPIEFTDFTLGNLDYRITGSDSYITSNKGSSTGTSGQQAIAHGLHFTPVRQQIMLIPGTATANPYHSAAPDSGYIYVTALSGQAWYWTTIND